MPHLSPTAVDTALKKPTAFRISFTEIIQGTKLRISFPPSFSYMAVSYEIVIAKQDVLIVQCHKSLSINTLYICRNLVSCYLVYLSEQNGNAIGVDSHGRYVTHLILESAQSTELMHVHI